MRDEVTPPGEYTGEGEDPLVGHRSVEKESEQYGSAEEVDTEGMGPGE